MWQCAAYKHGMTIFSDGIAPCCVIKSYKKPLSEIGNRNVFDDLITGKPPIECEECIIAESRNLQSYRQLLNKMVEPYEGLQIIDIRNSNLCNLKCRTCNPDASSQWAKENSNVIPITQSLPLEKYYDVFLTPQANSFYFTGGEPFLIQNHWTMLEKLIELGYSKNIILKYNTNLTVLKYKDKDIKHLWEQFKQVTIMCSLDATSERFNYIRSGGNWHEVEKNLIEILSYKNVLVKIAYTVSILNIWNMSDDLTYFKSLNIPADISILNNPDILSVNCIPDELKNTAIESLMLCKELISNADYNALQNMILNNNSKHLFKSTMSHILYLDKIRNEKLFDLLPFNEIAYKLMVHNP